MARETGRGLHIGLWVVQVLLAVGFGLAGFAKVATALPELAVQLPYTADLPGWLVRLIGVSEVAGALGLILPAATGIQPKLTPMAACGLVTVMALATIFHLFRAEYTDVPLTLVLGGLAYFVYWGRRL